MFLFVVQGAGIYGELTGQKFVATLKLLAITSINFILQHYNINLICFHANKKITQKLQKYIIMLSNRGNHYIPADWLQGITNNSYSLYVKKRLLTG